MTYLQKWQTLYNMKYTGLLAAIKDALQLTQKGDDPCTIQNILACYSH